jgi:Zn-dependent peptidase ImmA (M78 family)
LNDRHSKRRQASDLAHELAHALQQHPPGQALNQYGCRIWPKEAEAEADWLAPALLVSEEAAVSIVRRGLQLSEAAEEYGVSEDLMRFRLNMTGANRRVRAKAR